MSIGAFIFANLIIAVIVANLELSVKELRDEMKLHDNPLEYQEGRDVADIEIIPVYDLLAKNNFVCVSQRPLRIPKLKKVSTRKMQVYTSRKFIKIQISPSLAYHDRLSVSVTSLIIFQPI